MKPLIRFIVAATIALSMQSAGASALAVTYSFSDLTDSIPGADRWGVAYRAAGVLEAFGGFNVLFDPSDFAVLSIDSLPPGWSAYTLEPDPVLSADGVFSATIASSGVLPADFLVSFDWIGSSTPGSQPLEIFDPNFNTIATGITSPVPEPSHVLLMITGLGALAATRRRYWNRNETCKLAL